MDKSEKRHIPWKRRLLYTVVCGLAVLVLRSLIEKSVQYKRERRITRHFKRVVKTTWWGGTKTIYVERDRPLTDEELDQKLAK